MNDERINNKNVSRGSATILDLRNGSFRIWGLMGNFIGSAYLPVKDTAWLPNPSTGPSFHFLQ